MKLLQRFFLSVLLCGASLFLNACASHDSVVVSTAGYARVVTADFEGKWIAEFIAEGEIRETEDGYRFSAVERRIFSPQRLEFRYPLGRPVTVNASNVVITPVAKPLWLERADEGRIEFGDGKTTVNP